MTVPASGPAPGPAPGLAPGPVAGLAFGPGPSPAPAPLAVRFGWPLQPAQVLRRFDPPPEPWLAGHRGVDVGGVPGMLVRAAGAGTVVFAGKVGGRGVASVAHTDGLRTT